MILTKYDVIVVGGSYSGLSAAMTLARSLRNILVIDSGLPCNIQTPYSHNFLTHDGETPTQISSIAHSKVSQYKTVNNYEGKVVKGWSMDNGFRVETGDSRHFEARKLIFATGLKDVLPPIEGFAQCWGISILHCPYCHGYEVRNVKTGIIGNGTIGYDLARLISNWTSDLTLLTNGICALTSEQLGKLEERNVTIVETEIRQFQHEKGYINSVLLMDMSTIALEAIYTRPPHEQHCTTPIELGCEVSDTGLIKVDMAQRTTVAGIYACGDNSSPGRAIATAVAAGMIAGAAVNGELIQESF